MTRPALRPHRLALVVPLLLLLAGCGSGTGGSGTGGSGTGGGTDPSPPPLADARPLLGEAVWELVDAVVDDRPVTVPAGSRVTLYLDGHDRVAGTSACNSYGGQIRVSGDSVQVDRLGGTEMGCAPDVMAAESAYLDALQRVSTGSRDGDRLVLSGDGVDLAFVEQPPVPTADLVGTTWRLTTLVDGEVASSVVGDPATLRLDAGGTLTGSTGCRDLTGEYVVSGDEVRPTSLAAEDRGCPADLAGQDSHVVGVLEGFRAQVDGRTLTLTGSGGRGLVYEAE